MLPNKTAILKKTEYKLIQQFSKRKLHVQHMMAWFPDQIINFLDTFDKPCDTVLIFDELWRYSECNQIIIDHPKFKNKDTFIITGGYENQQLGPRLWKLSWPTYFLSNLNKPEDFEIKPRNLQHGFNCLNNRLAVHRVLLGYYLLKKNLLNQVLFTQLINGPLNADIFKTLPDFDQYKNTLPIELIDSADPTSGRVADLDIYVYHKSYHSTYCNIVTETETEDIPFSKRKDVEFLSEKSYKPFVAKQIPLILSCRGHISYLKSLGFGMMEDLLPGGYDQMWTEQKISAIVDVVARGRDYIENFYFDHIREIEHNHELYFSGKIEQTMIQNIKSICDL